MTEQAPQQTDPNQLRKLQEEEAKLSATWINNLAVATLAIGLVQPLVAAEMTLWSSIPLFVSAMLHMLARFVLQRQFPKEQGMLSDLEMLTLVAMIVAAALAVAFLSKPFDRWVERRWRKK